MSRISLLVIVVLHLCAFPLHAADWAQWRGPQANGIAPDTGINTTWAKRQPRVLWKAPLTDGGYAGPAVAAGKVFIIDHQGKQDIVKALDVKNGKPVWQFRYADTDRGNYGFARSTPIASGGKVYTISRLGLVHCLDAKNGKKLWSRDIIKDFGGKRPQWDLGMSPYIDGNKVILQPGGKNAAVVALDKNNGKTLWQGGGSDMPGYATPVLASINGTRQYVIFTAYNLIGVDTNKGKLLWSFPWRTGCDVNAATPIVVGNTIFITSGYGHGCALVEVKGTTARARWESKEIQAHFSSPIYANGYIYGTGDPGNLVCLELANGRVRWKQNGFEKGGVVGVNGTIIALAGNSGDLVQVKMAPDRYGELGRFRPLGGQSWTAPIVANGKLIIRNTNQLAYLDLK